MLGHKQKAQSTARKGNSSALRQGANLTMDVKSYRGNLYKQTLSPDWSKRRLRQAQDKFSKIDEDARKSIDNSYSPLDTIRNLKGKKSKDFDVSKRDNFLDTRIAPVPEWKNRTIQQSPNYSANAPVKPNSRLFTKTVTNFA